MKIGTKAQCDFWYKLLKWHGFDSGRQRLGLTVAESRR